ncbi:MAG: tRNA lysidine(34) synthetase TilS [Treponema sp.]|nr:tRNA lysidine(34) synthetase TilS [Treponema sp.]
MKDAPQSSFYDPRSPNLISYYLDIINKFENNVSSFLLKYQKNASLLAAVSGGADSMALLASLCALRDSGIINQDALFCIHVEHGLRPEYESRGDAEFVRNYCKTNRIKCCVKFFLPGKINLFAKRKGTGIEAAARYFRHRSLLHEAKRLDSLNNRSQKTFILLAHTKDDLQETALMRILRGAGPVGLCVMPVRRGRLLRPLLPVTRADIIKYLNAKKILWREDSTNNDEIFLRNRVRRQLVPLLNESFPFWKKGVIALAKTQLLIADFITEEAIKSIKWEVLPKSAQRKAVFTEAQRREELFTEEEIFFSQPEIVREEAVFNACNTLFSSLPLRDTFSNKTVKRSVVRNFCEEKVKAADLGTVKIKRKDGKVIISRVYKEFFECGFSRLIKEKDCNNL